MKKILILSAIAMSGLVFSTANAQGLHINLGLGPQRIVYASAPAVVDQSPVYSDNDDDFYYLPDLGVYYDVDAQCYFYFNGANWISAAYLPGEYRDYDWRNARRFEVKERLPYMRDDFYRSRYNGYRITDWRRRDFDGRFDRGFENRGYRDGDRFDNRDQRDNRDRGRFDNRDQRDYNHFAPQNRDNDQHFDHRGQGGFGQPAPQNRDNGQRFDQHGQGGFSQPAPQNSGNGQRFENHGHDNSGQPAKQGHDQGQRGGNDRFGQNNPHGEPANHKVDKFM